LQEYTLKNMYLVGQAGEAPVGAKSLAIARLHKSSVKPAERLEKR
jgi:hypothetical protein